MGWMIVGLALFCLLHLVRSIAAEPREMLIQKLGREPYRGLVALLLIGSVVLIVIGWRSTLPSLVYFPPAWGRSLSYPLLLATFILFAASVIPTNIRRYVRQQQLTGVLAWSLGHLLANGEGRSLLLFATLGVWALLEMLLISRREGAWQKPERVRPLNDIAVVAVGVVAYVLVSYAHPWLAGVALH